MCPAQPVMLSIPKIRLIEMKNRSFRAGMFSRFKRLHPDRSHRRHVWFGMSRTTAPNPTPTCRLFLTVCVSTHLSAKALCCQPGGLASLPGCRSRESDVYQQRNASTMKTSDRSTHPIAHPPRARRSRSSRAGGRQPATCAHGRGCDFPNRSLPLKRR